MPFWEVLAVSPLVPYRAVSCEAKGKEIAFLLHDCHSLLGLELGCAAMEGGGGSALGAEAPVLS